MAIKIKYRDPKATDFGTNDIVINVKEGSLFYKTSNNNLYKIQGDNIATTVDESTAYYSSSLQVLEHITSSGNISSSGDVFGNNLRVDSYIHFKDFDDQGTTYTTQLIARDDNINVWNGGFAVGQYADGNAPKTGNGNLSVKQNAIIEGNLTSSGNISSSGNITASAFQGEGSGITGIVSASYALTSSHEVTLEVSSSHAVTASHALTGGSGGSSLWYDGSTFFTSSLPIIVEGNISSSLQLHAGNLELSGSANGGGYIKYKEGATSATLIELDTLGTIVNPITYQTKNLSVNHYINTNGTMFSVNPTSSPHIYLSDSPQVLVSSSLIPAGSGSFDLGSTTNPWNNLHVMNSSIHFYDEDGEIGRIKYEKNVGLTITDESDSVEGVTSTINGGFF